MTDFFIYLIQVNVAFVLFYIVYRIFLDRKSSLYIRRFYLLSSSVFAFVLPFVKFPENTANNLKAVNHEFGFGEFEQLNMLKFLPTTETNNAVFNFSSFQVFMFIYLIISVLFLFVTIYSIAKIFKSIAENQKIRIGNLNLIINEKYVNPFSFFNNIFIKTNKNITKTPEYVHELAHVNQLHSIDRLLVELFISLLWINPFIYLFKKSLIEVHEHLADFAVIRNGVKPKDYQKYLFLQLKSGQYFKMTSNFNYSLTKKRITMISKNISIRKSIIRTSLSLIIVAGIFLFYGFNNHKISKPIIYVRNSLISKPINNFSNRLIVEPFTDIPSILPLKEGGDYYIGASFGRRKHPVYKTIKMHTGIDIVADRGTEIIATADGIVTASEVHGGYGKTVTIKHNEKYVTLYAHLSAYNVKVGDVVKTKDVIGYVGSTGMSTTPHLHYEVREHGRWINPANFIKNIKEIPRKKK